MLLTFFRAGSSKRSWQKLPRHLRRRAASHDTRRVPTYLREKAKAEVRPSVQHANRQPTLVDGSTKKWRSFQVQIEEGGKSEDSFSCRNIVEASKSVPSSKSTRMWLMRIVLKLGDKLWLETHIWHAKRMRMETLWGYRLVRFTPSHAFQKLTLSY